MSYYVKDTKFNRQALSQVYGILCDYDEEDLDRIPLNIRNVIEDNRDMEYDFTIDDGTLNNEINEWRKFRLKSKQKFW